jgi:hypothetical protein
MDLTPLVTDEDIDIVEFTCDLVSRFQSDVRARLSARLGKP